MEDYSYLLSNYKDNLNEIFQLDDYCHKYNKAFKVVKIEPEERLFLKVYDKKEIEKGPKKFLKKQIEREFKLTKECEDCENIIQLKEKVETDLSIIYAYEISTYNLFDYLKDNCQLSKNPSFFIKIIQSLAKALKKLNEKNIIHRDIKPENIFIVKKDIENEDDDIEENCIIKLGDFGSSIKKEENDNMQIGTILYLPPEILKKSNYDEKCDLWSLGITLYYLYFGFSPYGIKYHLDIILDSIFADNFIYKFSEIPALDILFKKLLTIDPANRMTHEEFYEYAFSKELEESLIESKIEYPKKYENIYKEIQNIIITDEYKQIQIKYIPEGKDEKVLEKERIKGIIKTALARHLLNADYSLDKEEMEEKEKESDFKGYINVIYYSENPDIDEDIDEFKKETSGAFFFCNKIESLEVLINEIFESDDEGNIYTFHLIINEKSFDDVMNLIITKYKCYLKYMSFSILCHDNNKGNGFKNEKYEINVNVYSEAKEVVDNFINKNKSKEIIPFYVSKLITYDDYLQEYFLNHLKISLFYEDFSSKSYEDNFNNIKELVNKSSHSQKKKKGIIESFKQFFIKDDFQTYNIDEDIEKLNEKIIKEYTKNTFFGDLNKWLREINRKTFKEVAYFTSRLMLSLNKYAENNHKYFNENLEEIYRGITLDYSSLLAYERALGKIIIFTAFSSMTKDMKLSKNFSKSYGNQFSVTFIVTNINKEGWISNGIDIQDLSDFKKEKEIIYLPFSFFLVKKVDIIISKKEAIIELDTIGKKEILEKIIKDGNHIVKYFDIENIVKSFVI